MAQRSPFVIPGLPDHRDFNANQLHSLYAIELADGTVKIGTTWNPSERVPMFCRRVGVLPVRAAVVSIPADSARFKCERWALDRARRIAGAVKGRERFMGLNFGQARNLIKQAVRADRKEA